MFVLLEFELKISQRVRFSTENFTTRQVRNQVFCNVSGFEHFLKNKILEKLYIEEITF